MTYYYTKNQSKKLYIYIIHIQQYFTITLKSTNPNKYIFIINHLLIFAFKFGTFKLYTLTLKKYKYAKIIILISYKQRHIKPHVI